MAFNSNEEDILPPYTPIEYKWNFQTLFLGFTLGLKGIKNTLFYEKTRKKLIQEVFLFLMISLIIYITGQYLSIPFHCLKLLKLFGVSNAGFFAETFNKILLWTIRIFPQAILLVIRYIFPKYLDELFFESFIGYPLEYKKGEAPSMELLNALNYAQQLSKRKPNRNYIVLFYNYCKRILKKLVKGSFIYLLICIPFVGKFITPGMLIMALNQFMPVIYSCGIGILTVCNATAKKVVTAILFNCIFGVRAMNREILEPFFCRVKMSSQEKSVWFRTYEPLLFGFMGLFYVLFIQPWYGPLFFVFAQGAIPTLLVEIFKYHQPTLRKMK